MTNAEKLLRAYLGIPEATPIHPTHTLSWVAALDAMNRLMENIISNNNEPQQESEHNNNTIAKEYTLDDAKNEVAKASAFDSWTHYLNYMVTAQFSRLNVIDVMNKVAQLYADKKVNESTKSNMESLVGYTFTNEFNSEVEVLLHDANVKYCMVKEEGRKKPYVLPLDFVLAIKKESEENKID